MVKEPQEEADSPKADAFKKLYGLLAVGQYRALEIWKTLENNNLWKRMVKNILTTTIVGELILLTEKKDQK